MVATQTVEVGANVDFDALVTESAPLGLSSTAVRSSEPPRQVESVYQTQVIVLRPKDDVVYGAATANTWKFLTEHTPVDFGIAAMRSLLNRLDLVGMNSASSPGPLLFPAHLEFWVSDKSPSIARSRRCSVSSW